MTIKHEIVAITPAMATAMLLRNNANREISDACVDKYARAMSANKWPFLGDPIREDTDGNILDGQHRLHAVEQSGCTVEFLLLSGIPAENQKYMDSGRVRSAADNVRMMGISQPTITAAAARLLLTITNPPADDGSWDGLVRVGAYSGRVTTLSNHEIADFVAEHRDLEASASVGVPTSYSVQAQPTVLTFVHYLARRIDEEKADTFFGKLSTGADLELGSPIRAAREAINRSRREGSRDGHVNLYLLIQAWNRWRGEREVSRLQLPAGGIVSTTTLTMI